MIKYDWFLIFFFMAEWFKSYEKKKIQRLKEYYPFVDWWVWDRLGHENLLRYNHKSRIIMDSEHVISMSEV